MLLAGRRVVFNILQAHDEEASMLLKGKQDINKCQAEEENEILFLFRKPKIFVLFTFNHVNPKIGYATLRHEN
jgi:hypothetical protein